MVGSHDERGEPAGILPVATSGQIRCQAISIGKILATGLCLRNRTRSFSSPKLA
jgi:hypothetical protein